MPTQPSTRATRAPVWSCLKESGPRLIPTCVVVYQLAVLLVCAFAISRAWPNNRWAQAIITQEQTGQLALQITRDRLELLSRGQAIVSQWRADDQVTLSESDLTALVHAIGYSHVLTALPRVHDDTDAAVDEILWTNAVASVTRANLDRIEGLLLGARTELALRPSRIRDVMDSVGSTSHRWWPPWRGMFPRSQEVLLGTYLTPDEEAELIERQGAMPAPDHASLLGSMDLDFLVLLAAFGALGAVIQSLASVGRYLGEKKFISSWFVFYLFRPMIGAGVATALYLSLRAGMAPGATMDVTNPYVVCALAMIVGLFSGEAMEKLKDIAGAMFISNRAKDSLDDKTPMIRSVTIGRELSSPLDVGGGQWQIEIAGTHFDPDCYVMVNRTIVDRANTQIKPRATDKAETTVLVWLPTEGPEALHEKSEIQIVILNPSAGGGRSAPYKTTL